MRNIMKQILKTTRKRIKGIVYQQKGISIHTSMSKVVGIVAIVVFLLIVGSTITIAQTPELTAYWPTDSMR